MVFGSFFLRSMLLLGCASALAGCSTLGTALDTAEGWVGLGGKVSLRKLRIVADSDANKSSACRVDIVALFGDSAATMLPATSTEWFAQRRALQDGLGSAIAVRSYELPPATLIENAELPPNIEKASGLRAYVELHASGGRHFIDLSANDSATLHLTARNAVLQPEP